MKLPISLVALSIFFGCQITNEPVSDPKELSRPYGTEGENEIIYQTFVKGKSVLVLKKCPDDVLLSRDCGGQKPVECHTIAASTFKENLIDKGKTPAEARQYINMAHDEMSPNEIGNDSEWAILRSSITPNSTGPDIRKAVIKHVAEQSIDTNCGGILEILVNGKKRYMAYSNSGNKATQFIGCECTDLVERQGVFYKGSEVFYVQDVSYVAKLYCSAPSGSGTCP